MRPRLDGRAISLGAAGSAIGGSVSLAANTVAACSYGRTLPTSTAFKVTGGGSINVPDDPAVTDPDATGGGRANYGFNGQPAGAAGVATGHFNYVNHVVAGHLHINGPVTGVDVVALAPDGTPQTARLSGTCDQFLPSCTFSVLTEDTVSRRSTTASASPSSRRVRSWRRARSGSCATGTSSSTSRRLTTTVNASTSAAGQTMRLVAKLRKDTANIAADAYVVLRLPGGQLLSWTGGRSRAGASCRWPGTSCR